MIDPLIVDVYEGDGNKVWTALVASGPPWHGVILKCTQGVYYSPAWYAVNRRAVRTAARDRLGHDFFEGAYHFADLGNDGAAQARFAWRAIEAAGGELPGTLPLMLDVERGGQSITNPTAQRVRDVVSSFAETYLALSGRRPTLYTGELARALGLRDMMGCERGVVALYGKELHGANESTVQFLERTAGMTLETLLAWQYCGDGVRELAGYPNEAPGVGRCDISVLTLPGGLEAVRAIAQPGPTTLR